MFWGFDSTADDFLFFVRCFFLSCFAVFQNVPNTSLFAVFYYLLSGYRSSLHFLVLFSSRFPGIGIFSFLVFFFDKILRFSTASTGFPFFSILENDTLNNFLIFLGPTTVEQTMGEQKKKRRGKRNEQTTHRNGSEAGRVLFTRNSPSPLVCGGVYGEEGKKEREEKKNRLSTFCPLKKQTPAEED